MKWILKNNSAKGGSRTPTPLRALDPKSSASTNSATLAILKTITFKARASREFLCLLFFVGLSVNAGPLV